jgi:hypothetical protein
MLGRQSMTGIVIDSRPRGRLQWLFALNWGASRGEVFGSSDPREVWWSALSCARDSYCAQNGTMGIGATLTRRQPNAGESAAQWWAIS